MGNAEAGNEKLVLKPGGCFLASIAVAAVVGGGALLMLLALNTGRLFEELPRQGFLSFEVLVLVFGGIFWSVPLLACILVFIGDLSSRCILDSAGLTFVGRDIWLRVRSRFVPWSEVQTVFTGRTIWGGVLTTILLKDGSVPKMGFYGRLDLAMPIILRHVPADAVKPYRRVTGKRFRI